MPELLLEVGCEELPAHSVTKALRELVDRLSSALTEAGVLAAEAPEAAAPISYGTPRRLIVSFANLESRQADRTKEQRGPAIRAAFDADGNPTPALLGFCRGQGVDVADLRNDGQYVWAEKHIAGQPTIELLAEILPKVIRSIPFDKTMRWGGSRMRFARPIRWLLATLDGEVIKFDIEGVVAGSQSRGHRFLSPETFEASSLEALISGLRARFVEPDAEVRRARILDGAKAVAAGNPDLPIALVDENVHLTEWPIPIAGTFKEIFAELPDPVLITAMAKHEKMFPVRDASGKLTRQFVFVRNSGEDDSVRNGCEWVLNARFNDAKFFHDEDKKRTLEEFREATKGILFQEKLGTVLDRTLRLESLAEEVALATGADAEERELARLAARLAKADLASGLVGELTSLQGVVGGEYARREGIAEPVAFAIASQYDVSKALNPSDAAGRTAARLQIADQLDKLAGYLGIGLEPTGTSDPFALRRAVGTLIELAWGWPGALPAYDQLFDAALAQYKSQGVALEERPAHAALYDMFSNRYPTMLPDVRYDILNAATLRENGWEATMPQAVRFRTRVLAELASDTAFVQTATRPLNLIVSAKKKGLAYAFEDPLGQIDPVALQSEEGAALLAVLKDQEEALFIATREERTAEVVTLLKALEAPINRFFDTTMVIAEDESVRFARLTLLHAASLQLLNAGDFSSLVIEG